MRRAAIVLLAGVAAGSLAACGGAGSNAERDRLVRQLSSATGNLPPDLAACVDQQARGLPLPQLREVAAAGASATPAAKQVAVRLLTSCIQQGKGVAALRQLLVRQIASTFPSTLPASYTSCVERQAGAVSPSQLAAFISAYATAGAGASQVQAVQYGRQLGIQCLHEPSVLASLRAVFLKPLQALARSGRYSKAFSECLLGKAQRISAAQLEQFALHPATASTLGNAFGRAIARACVAEGARP